MSSGPYQVLVFFQTPIRSETAEQAIKLAGGLQDLSSSQNSF